MNGFIYDEQLVEQLLDKIVRRTMAMNMTWDWPCGVAYYGILRAYEATGREEYLGLVKDRIDEYIGLGLPEGWTVNKCAMGHCLLTLSQVYEDSIYREIAESKVRFLKEQALRFGQGVLQHTVSRNNDFPQQCWADTLFMAAYFMLRAGVRDGDKELIEDALNQYYWHMKYLQNRTTGLWYHLDRKSVV